MLCLYCTSCGYLQNCQMSTAKPNREVSVGGVASFLQVFGARLFNKYSRFCAETQACKVKNNACDLIKSLISADMLLTHLLRIQAFILRTSAKLVSPYSWRWLHKSSWGTANHAWPKSGTRAPTAVWLVKDRHQILEAHHTCINVQPHVTSCKFRFKYCSIELEKALTAVIISRASSLENWLKHSHVYQYQRDFSLVYQEFGAQQATGTQSSLSFHGLCAQQFSDIAADV